MGITINNREYTVLETIGKEAYNTFCELYKKDPVAARIFALKHNSVNYVIKFGHPTKNHKYFVIEHKIMTYGVSVSRKKYHRFKVVYRVSYTAKGVYSFDHGGIRALSWAEIGQGNGYIRKVFMESIPWLEYLAKYDSAISSSVSLNAIIRNKLDSYHKIVKYATGMEVPFGEFILYFYPQKVKYIKQNKRFILGSGKPNLDVLIGMMRNATTKITKENYREQFAKSYAPRSNSILFDTIDMAVKLCQTVNLAWSEKRLKREHDRMAKELIAYEQNEPDWKLYIHPYFQFIEFAARNMGFWGQLSIIQTKHDLIAEGVLNKNCVSGYDNASEASPFAIYHFRNSTLEIGIDNNSELRFYLRQMAEFGNDPSPMKDKEIIRSIMENASRLLRLKLSTQKDENGNEEEAFYSDVTETIVA